ncbi:hypothetical protein CY652_12955 [Burkholderia sp. WAC0059]|uniref:(2Fe-2S)-binding protein n=1 Tax=Burkholderia sp. WAC0059 TaxID=2066022 RepID=UPI000C7F06CF|nr:(2Fe-2S)-binding protein [Burkholderia sp. WAC0059]PLZ01939.1 hypothetical protein CY652_12955 [Burkholderia sp. WAC0059]
MESLFRILDSSSTAASAPGVTIRFDGKPLTVPAGMSVSAALLANGARSTRTSAVSGAPRAPYCMMGVCFECLVEIDGVPNRQGCLTSVRDGMEVRTQNGARELDAGDAATQGSARHAG